MHTPKEKRYLYRAHAVAAAGEIKAPFQKLLDAQASTALPVTGGRGMARVERYHVDKVLSIGLAYTQAIGTFTPEENAYNTLVTATLENLNLLDMVTADRVVARLASRHPKDAGEQEASIVTVGSYFKNLRITGVQPVLKFREPLFSDLDTCEGVRRSAVSGGGYQERGGVILTSLIEEIAPIPGTKTSGNVIEVPQFGLIHLAELFITPSARRLTMIRVELGCSLWGSVSLCEIDGNGSEF